MPQECSVYFVIDKDGNELTSFGRHEFLRALSNGWVGMGQGAPQDDLHCVPTKQSVLFPLVNHTVLSVDAWGNALHVQMNPEWIEYGFYVEKRELLKNYPQAHI